MLAFLLIPAVALGALMVLLRQGAKARRVVEADLQRIRNLSESDAERIARVLINRSDVFQTTPATQPFSNAALPPAVVALFNEFSEVVSGEFYVGVNSIQPSETLPGYVQIGGDVEFTEILVLPGDSRIHVLGEGDETPEVEPSIWHEVIIASGVWEVA